MQVPIVRDVKRTTRLVSVVIPVTRTELGFSDDEESQTCFGQYTASDHVGCKESSGQCGRTDEAWQSLHRQHLHQQRSQSRRAAIIAYTWFIADGAKFWIDAAEVHVDATPRIGIAERI